VARCQFFRWGEEGHGDVHLRRGRQFGLCPWAADGRLLCEELWAQGQRLLFPSRRGHGRWEIENDLFHTLATYWSLDHCFKHEPTAIVNFILTLFIAFVLLQSFYRGNLKPQRRAYLTLIGLARELYFSLATLESPAPWLERGG
jgi:hypothetical protein